MSIYPFPPRPQNSFINNQALPPAPQMSSHKVLEVFHYLIGIDDEGMSVKGQVLALLTPPAAYGDHYWASDYAVFIEAGQKLVENQGPRLAEKLGNYAYATIKMDRGMVFIYAAWLVVKPDGGRLHA